jgi:hypothetical protein
MPPGSRAVENEACVHTTPVKRSYFVHLYHFSGGVCLWQAKEVLGLSNSMLMRLDRATCELCLTFYVVNQAVGWDGR